MLNQSSLQSIVVVGLGYVGLPLAIEFARAGFRVTGLEMSESKVERLKLGQSYLRDIESAEIAELSASGTFSATSDPAVLSEASAVIVCVPTPLSKTREPDIRYIVDAIDQIARHRTKGLLVVLESTTYPGTTRELLLPVLTAGDYEIGRDIFVAFSPERVDPGNPVYRIKNTPKIVAGASPKCLENALALYSAIVDELVPVSSLEVAETSKLFENTFRAVNIGLVNEVAMMARLIGVDPFEVIRAAATKPFGFMPFSPGPGLGGHCIPVDPLYLSWKLRSLNYEPQFIALADQINRAMPRYVVQRLAECLNEESRAVRGTSVLVYGVAYKADIDDARESPAIGVIQELLNRGAAVSYLDPFIWHLNEQGLDFVSVAADVDFGSFDAVIVVTNHSQMPRTRMLRDARLILDTRDSFGTAVCGIAKVRGL